MQPNDDPSYSKGGTAGHSYGDRLLATCGYLLIIASVLCFGVIAWLKLHESLGTTGSKRYEDMLDLLQHESGTISLLIIAVVAASLGKGLLITVHMADARTIPYEDLELVEQAVKDGKPEPIDQYVRLRSLTGMSGTFTKLGITGLPLTTVALTLIFSFMSLLPIARAESFLDLAKLTLGAFIGSFVQRQVEQRRQATSDAERGLTRRPDLPT
ncbi:hypothetical protein [Burkholderia sp. Ac-20365]|uniref:hypothetical protein n=1 Tax=Burkholderia sp. Ac-20365 TaxID=2703897 RepID=UPI00197B1D10|nr:hypothetical protein [Burkholderia sp. Ac-20365]